VSAAQFPILIWVFGTTILLCLVTFRSVRGTLCIIIPLALVSLLAYAIMAWLQIGLKVSTLPVVALGVGVGVDYGIYIYARFRTLYKDGVPLTEAYRRTLAITGNGVLFTGITLGLGVATWIFSPLKFQADMGLLLCFLFLMNMVGALVLLPALARWLLGDTHQGHG
ncbi:MAG TPA: MMPL family transporter, partial [Thermoanaerobaculia bacterium]|nr:MMPL family transporter [Thermoanaerobaculia bacterium]